MFKEMINQDLSPSEMEAKKKKIETLKGKMKTDFFKDLMEFTPSSLKAMRRSYSGIHYSIDEPKGNLDYRFGMKTDTARLRQLIINTDGVMSFGTAEKASNFNKNVTAQLDKKNMSDTQADLKNFGKYIELMNGYNPSDDIIKWIQENIS